MVLTPAAFAAYGFHCEFSTAFACEIDERCQQFLCSTLEATACVFVDICHRVPADTLRASMSFMEKKGAVFAAPVLAYVASPNTEVF